MRRAWLMAVKCVHRALKHPQLEPWPATCVRRADSPMFRGQCPVHCARHFPLHPETFAFLGRMGLLALASAKCVNRVSVLGSLHVFSVMLVDSPLRSARWFAMIALQAVLQQPLHLEDASPVLLADSLLQPYRKVAPFATLANSARRTPQPLGPLIAQFVLAESIR